MSKIFNNYLPEIYSLCLCQSKPSMVTVNLTSRCNQQCIYCEIGKNIPSSEKDILAKDDLFWIINQMAINKIRKISLCGGEPFLFKGIFNVVAYAHKKKIRTSITTNGMTVHTLNESELNVLKESKTEINLSIDSFDENVQTLTRGNPNALRNALMSFQRLNDRRIPVTILTVISKHNYQNLSGFFMEAYQKGIKQVLFQPVIYYSNYPDRQSVENKSQINVSVDKLDVLMDELCKILRFEKKHKINTNVYRILPWIKSYLKTAAGQNGKWFFHEVVNKFFCREVYAIIDISYNGGIQPCGLSPATVSIHKNQHLGLMALWSKATEEIKEDLNHDRYYEYCNGCCHHFSRNMLASIFKHPIKNRQALIKIIPLIMLRIQWRMLKKLSLQ